MNGVRVLAGLHFDTEAKRTREVAIERGDRLRPGEIIRRDNFFLLSITDEGAGNEGSTGVAVEVALSMEEAGALAQFIREHSEVKT